MKKVTQAQVKRYKQMVKIQLRGSDWFEEFDKLPVTAISYALYNWRSRWANNKFIADAATKYLEESICQQ